MPTPPADLRARRQALGATVEIMAVGVVQRAADIREIERGEASNAALNHYAAWLTRIERWSPEERERQYAAASSGRRFLVR